MGTSVFMPGCEAFDPFGIAIVKSGQCVTVIVQHADEMNLGTLLCAITIGISEFNAAIDAFLDWIPLFPGFDDGR